MYPLDKDSGGDDVCCTISGGAEEKIEYKKTQLRLISPTKAEDSICIPKIY